MSNVNNPHGLRPLMRNSNGGRPSCENYTKEVGYAQAIYQWDPVTELAGVLNGPASGITPGTTLYRGVALDYSLASVAAVMTIMDDVGAMYEAQEDATGAANAVAAKMGYNANLTTTAGNATLNTSKVQVSGTSIAVTGTLDVRVERLLSVPDNAYGANARLEIRFNKHLATASVTAT